jgi:ribonuclease P protein component
MLPRRNRLTKRPEIISALRRGTTFSTPFVSIHLRPRDDQPAPRLAVVVAKKVHASAVQRHRYQRWLRAAAAELLLELKNPVDMVWVAKPAIAQLSSAREVKARLQQTFAEIKRYA